MMRFYDRQHRYYAGIDLHARTMHLCVLDSTGAVVCDVNLPVRGPQSSGRGERPGGFDPQELFGAASRLTRTAKVVARQTGV
jgi:hypothetical protein